MNRSALSYYRRHAPNRSSSNGMRIQISSKFYKLHMLKTKGPITEFRSLGVILGLVCNIKLKIAKMKKLRTVSLDYILQAHQVSRLTFGDLGNKVKRGFCVGTSSKTWASRIVISPLERITQPDWLSRPARTRHLRMFSDARIINTCVVTLGHCFPCTQH